MTDYETDNKLHYLRTKDEEGKSLTVRHTTNAAPACVIRVTFFVLPFSLLNPYECHSPGLWDLSNRAGWRQIAGLRINLEDHEVLTVLVGGD